MSHRRSNAPKALTGLIAGVAALALASGATSATAANESASTQNQSVERRAETAALTVLPGIAQPGKGKASANKAKFVASARTSPASKKGRAATLERFDGTNWVAVSKTKVNRSRAAEFTLKPSLSGSQVRVTFAGGVSSAPVTAGAWGAADFSDEFNGRKLGSSWMHRGTTYNPQGLRRCSKGSPKAAKVRKGTVQLKVIVDKKKAKKTCVAKRGDGSKIGKFKYRLNGHISTMGKVDLRYGVVAARMKFQKRQGQHASFWLQPYHLDKDAASAHTGGAEIDVIEWFGQGGTGGGLTSFIYAPNGKGELDKIGGFLKKPNQYLANKKDSWWGRYHVFSVEWTPSAYVFRIDGRETYRTTKGVSGVRQFIILSLLSSDYELKKLGGEKNLPQEFDVDWVRVWQDKTQG
ncbi:MAG: glycoside hydrolase family 16 protein [Nocardioides sp.]